MSARLFGVRREPTPDPGPGWAMYPFVGNEQDAFFYAEQTPYQHVPCRVVRILMVQEAAGLEAEVTRLRAALSATLALKAAHDVWDSGTCADAFGLAEEALGS